MQIRIIITGSPPSRWTITPLPDDSIILHALKEGNGATEIKPFKIWAKFPGFRQTHWMMESASVGGIILHAIPAGNPEVVHPLGDSTSNKQPISPVLTTDVFVASGDPQTNWTIQPDGDGSITLHALITGYGQPDDLPSQICVWVPDSPQTHWSIDFDPDGIIILHALAEACPQIMHPLWDFPEPITDHPLPYASATDVVREGYPQTMHPLRGTQPPPSAPTTDVATSSGNVFVGDVCVFHSASTLLPPHPKCEPTPTTLAVKEEPFDADWWKAELEKKTSGYCRCIDPKLHNPITITTIRT